jgi:hypothetical protein
MALTSEKYIRKFQSKKNLWLAIKIDNNNNSVCVTARISYSKDG